MDKEMDLLKEVMEYLEPHGWEPMDVGVRMMLFKKTHGEEAVDAMGRYLKWVADNNEKNGVPATLAHDLNACDDSMTLPRTASY